MLLFISCIAIEYIAFEITIEVCDFDHYHHCHLAPCSAKVIHIMLTNNRFSKTLIFNLDFEIFDLRRILK